MDQLMQLLKVYKLIEFYFSLDSSEKEDFYFFSRHTNHWISASPPPDGVFMVTNASRFLWTTAANMIPNAQYTLAEKLLLAAEQRHGEPEDEAWTKANLAQLYFDQVAVNKDLLNKCNHYCQEVIDSGYFTKWAEKLSQQLQQLQ